VVGHTTFFCQAPAGHVSSFPYVALVLSAL